jgi:hypothetical protein
MRTVKFVLMLMLVLVIGVGVIHAEDDEYVPTIEDGRVNELDIAAPLAVYCKFVYPHSDDVNKAELDSIEVWGLNSAGNGEQVLTVTAAELSAASNGLVKAQNGYQLSRRGSLITASGAGYSFSWRLGAINC